MLRELWKDESGALITMELVLVATILLIGAIGAIAGLTSLRDAVVTELADLGASISMLDQSYTIHGTTSFSAATAGTSFVDLPDFGDTAQSFSAERCIVICTSAFAPVGNEGLGFPSATGRTFATSVSRRRLADN